MYPSKPTITAGKVEFIFGVKHYKDDVRNQAIEAIKVKAQEIAQFRSVEIYINKFLEMTSTEFPQEVISLVEEGVKLHGYSYQKMLSPAGHDARIMNEIAKTSMIFAPSSEGLSHCEEEFTSYEDIEKTANVLRYVVNSLASKYDVV